MDIVLQLKTHNYDVFRHLHTWVSVATSCFYIHAYTNSNGIESRLQVKRIKGSRVHQNRYTIVALGAMSITATITIYLWTIFLILYMSVQISQLYCILYRYRVSSSRCKKVGTYLLPKVVSTYLHSVGTSRYLTTRGSRSININIQKY